MVNPYKSPEQSVEGDVVVASRLWPIYHRIFASVFTTVVSGFLIFWAWRFLGHEKPLIAAEIRLWLLLVSGILLIGFSSSRLRRNHLNVASVSRYIFGITGTLVLASMSGIFIEMFMAWYSGVEYEFFAYSQRLFGSFAWIYWLSVATLCFLPIVICLHGVARRRWIVVPVLMFVCFVAAANLRFSYILNHANFVPSSWSHFFWLP